MAPHIQDDQFISTQPTATTKSNIVEKLKATNPLTLEGSDKHDLVLRVFRCYIADLCEQFKGGHPG